MEELMQKVRHLQIRTRRQVSDVLSGAYLSVFKEAGIEVNRPEAATAVKKERANILVAISDKGEVWINKRQVDIRAVQANIERLYAENPQGSVVIQADKKATTEVLIKVMDASRAAGVFDVSIATDEP